MVPDYPLSEIFPGPLIDKNCLFYFLSPGYGKQIDRCPLSCLLEYINYCTILINRASLFTELYKISRNLVMSCFSCELSIILRIMDCNAMPMGTYRNMYRFLPGKLPVLLVMLCLFGCSGDDGVYDIPSELLQARRYDTPGIYDGNGRYMLMRGVNLNTLGDYWEGNPAVPATAPYNADHFRLMAGYGFNTVRLLFHWSAVEPEKGQYDFGYISRIRQAVEDAAEYGIYTLLDMHQDAYSKFIFTPPDEVCERPGKGWDGAPEWATLTGGTSTCTSGPRESAPAVYNAWRNFWNDEDGIRSSCIAAWQEVVRATADHPYVLGYDALNEPALGNGSLQGQLNKYSNYLNDLLRGIREAEREAGGLEHIFFFENTVGWNGEEVPSSPAFDFTRDRNIVFAPHNYFEVIVRDILTIEQGAELFDNLARLYGTHCFIGEWGVFGNPASQLPKLERFAAAEDQYFMGSTWWQWCQAPGDPHSMNWAGDAWPSTSLHLMEVAEDGSYTGNVNHTYLNVLSRARPVAIHGRPRLLESDVSTRSMILEASAAGKGITRLWIPGQPPGPQIEGTGLQDFVLYTVEGGFMADCTVKGDYRLEVSY
jgi:endoglycosylceramidase